MWDGDVVHEWAVGDGSVVGYSDDGAGPLIVLIHAGVFADWFGPTATVLRNQGFQVVRLRRAGYGHTAPRSGLSLMDHASHTADVMDHLGVTGAHVVGHSSSALVALDLAAARPDLVERLTLFEPAPGGPFAPPRPGDASPPAPDLADDPFDAFMTVACGPDYLPVLTDALGPAGVDRARIESAYFLSDEFPAVVTWPFGDDTARAITQPVTLAWGSSSWSVYRDVCEQLGEMLPRVDVISVDGGDHLYPLRHPTEFADFVAERTAPAIT
jgi:pimeloyl-ACP methyl ester carboxylesterase